MDEMATRKDRERARDRNAELAALFDFHYLRLHGLAYVMLCDSAAAEEVVMETFIKLLSTWPTLRNIDHPPSYLRKMVVNRCRSRIRRTKLEQKVISLFQTRRETTGAERDAEAGLDLWKAVAALPERQRSCVVLRYLEDMTESEIADLLECSVGTVKSNLSRARGKLDRLLRPGGEEG